MIGIVALAVGLTGCQKKVNSHPAPPPATTLVPPASVEPSPQGSWQSASPSGTPGTAGLAPRPVDCVHRGNGKDYSVGPGKAYGSIGEVPFELIKGGDTVRIFWRSDAYHEKMMISGQGTATQPVRVCGVAGPRGQLPVIDGKDATTRPQLRFPFDGHQARGLIVVGHKHGDTYETPPKHIVIESLEIRNASTPFSYRDKSGVVAQYPGNVAGIFVQRVDGLIIRGCTITQNNNGLFMGTGGGVELSRDVLIEGNDVFGNGNLVGDREHNTYNEVSNIVYQFNHFGPPRIGSGSGGANIKDRSAGAVVRYNWIEGGAHLLDIVDAQEAAATTLPLPSFHSTYVYGNLMISSKAWTGSMVHYGGDSYVFQNYRKGTLFFYNNTVIMKNELRRDYDRPAVFEISTNDEHLLAKNNIFYSTNIGTNLRPVVLLGDRDKVASGIATFANNWVTNGWTTFDPTPGSTVQRKGQMTGLEASTRGTAPGFKNSAEDDYQLVATSPCMSLGAALPSEIPANLRVDHQYVKHMGGVVRRDAKGAILGAFGAS